MPEDEQESIGKGHWFTTTSWSGIQAIQTGGPNAREALERLCRAYWYPLYAYIRRSGRGPEEAEDLTQGFFHELLEKNLLGAVDRKRGRFRSFLLGALKYYLHNEERYRSAQKRGGGKALISLDEQRAEGRYLMEPSVNLSPEMMFEQRWAAELMENVREQLGAEYKAMGKLTLHEALSPFLEEETHPNDYSQLAVSLSMKPNTVAVCVRRLRHRYRELIRFEIARTVADPEEIDQEVRHLYRILVSFSTGTPRPTG